MVIENQDADTTIGFLSGVIVLLALFAAHAVSRLHQGYVAVRAHRDAKDKDEADRLLYMACGFAAQNTEELP